MSRKLLLAPSSLANASEIHRAVLGLLRQLYPKFTVRENEPIQVPGLRGGRTTLYVDLVVPDLKLCIECHGEQHFRYTPHFHGPNPESFCDSQERDRAKEEAIRKAGWAFLMIRFDEYKTLTKAQMNRKIKQALKESL